jgi:hypothetical protein
MLGEQCVTVVAIFFVLPLRDVEVITPARQFDALVAERLGLLGNSVEGQVGPLAGKKSYGACHKFKL